MPLREARVLSGIVLVLGLAVIGVVLSLRLFSVLFLATSVAIGAAAFLLYARRQGSLRTAIAERGPRKLTPAAVCRIQSVLTMLFFLLTAGSLLEAVRTPYAKPELYYVLAAASAAALAARISLLEGQKQVPHTLGMVLVLALNLFGSDQLAFPLGIGGADSPAHVDALVRGIAASGFVPTGSCGGSQLIYFFFPASHVYVASSAILLAMNPVNAYYFMGFVGMTLPVLIVFAIARPILGTRVALFASLLLSGSSYYLFWASHASTTTFAIPLIAAFVLALRELHRRQNALMLIAVAFLSLALVLTHPYSSVMFVLILAGMAVGQLFARRANHLWVWGLRVSAVIFICTLLIEWTNFSCLMPTALGYFRDYISTLTGRHLVASAGAYDVLPWWTLLINTIADSILLVLAIIGFLLLYAGGFSKAHMLLVGPGIALLAVAFVGQLTNLIYLLPGRVYAYLQFIAFAPLGGLALGVMLGRPGKPPPGERSPLRILFVAILAAMFVFGSTASTIAGFETSPFRGGQPYVKLYNTQYEQSSANWICQHLAPSVVVQVAQTMQGLSEDQARRCGKTSGSTFTPYGVTANGTIKTASIKSGDYVWYSSFDVSTEFQYKLTAVGRYGSAVYARLQPTAVNGLQNLDGIYDNGHVQVYWNQTGVG